jgi:hippurate hydrolase
MRATLAAASLALSLPLAAQATEVTATWLDGEAASLLALYQHLHQHPELSFKETATSQRMAEELRPLGIEVTEHFGGNGVVGVLKNGDGPVVLLRADMDALPVAEQTGLPYASAVKATAADGQPIGVMHACGHDMHMTCLVGTARWLAQNRGGWHGTVLFVLQPAEERAGGAKAMLAAGLLEKFPRPACGIALHCSGDLATDTVGVRAGYAMANVDSCDITMFGRGSHGAQPHLAIDPIVQAAQLVLDLQTIVSREVDPVEPSVVTVGAIHGGSKHNIIGDHCDLQVTLRSYAPAVREQLKEAVVRKAKAVALGARAPEPKVEFSEPTPALKNDAALTATVTAALTKAFGSQHVVAVPPVMGAEDFGRFGDAGVPICMFRLGTIEPARLASLQAAHELPSLHSGRYWPDAAPSLRTGVRALVAALLSVLSR